MAPITRRAAREKTPPNQRHVGEYDTIEKDRFFNAYDREHGEKSIPTIAIESGTTESTAKRWLHDRRLNGRDAHRHTRKRSKVLGHKSRVTKEQCQRLVSPSNLVRDQFLEAQIKHFNIGVKPRQLKIMLKRHTKGARRFKQAYIKKKISPANKQKRINYGVENKGKTVEDYYQFIFYTDEFHVDPSSMGAGYILREEGTRENPKNI
jgi:transposase